MSNRLYAFFLLLGLLVVIFISNPSLGLAQTPTPQAGGSSPSGGLPILPITLAAIGGALALVLLQTIGKQVANGVITWLHALVWNWLSGKPLFRIFNLNRYRNALRENNSKIKIPFRSEPIDMHNIYVPLKVEGADDRDQLDARGAVSLHRRMMIIGDPGSGKSIFMRYLALAYAENNLSDLEDRPIPVLLELHRLNDDRPIEEHLVEALDRNRFPNASVFVSRNLKDGRLMPLFDGFDEVNSSVRSRVAQDIIDFLSQYEKCRVVITSRPPAYNDEFAEQIPTKLQIVSFIDHQIRSFLSSWEPDMPEGKSVDQLMQTLDERPAIMSLARNPLMLTIIAYLYADTPYILPHSRVEFYSQSADVLLRQLNRTTPGDEALKYTPPEKRSVLQHLAASIQERSSQNNRDRSTLEYQIVVDEVGAVLSRLNRKPEDVLPLIEEIVNGSGLLLRIDGGQRYEFGHLTLQEFFAAEQLRDDPEGLVEKYKADGQTWRESLKLWCGLQRDNTPVVKAIYALDEMLGFECLADAHEVEPDTTNTIIDYFRSKLGQSDTDDAVARAFGILAMDDTPIGNETFTFLKSTLSDESEGSTRHLAAATALSLSNMPRGAEALAEHYELQGIRPFLVRMGGVSVSALVTLAKNGAHSALEDLKELGSPQAAEALTSLIWEESDTAHRAAWPLAELLADEEIANSLRRVSLSPDQCNAPGVSDYRWVWEPFETDEDASQDCPSLPTIASRLAYLISKGVESDLGYSINARLAVPLLAIEDYEESLKAASESGLSELVLCQSWING